MLTRDNFTLKYEITERYHDVDGLQYVERTVSTGGETIASEYMRSSSQRGELNRIVRELHYISGMSTESTGCSKTHEAVIGEKPTESNTTQAIKKPKQAKRNPFFRTVKKLFLDLQKQRRLKAYPFLWHYLIFADTLEETSACCLYEHIELMKAAGWRLQVTRLPVRSTNGCIALLQSCREGKLKYQKELRIVKEDSGAIHIDFC